MTDRVFFYGTLMTGFDRRRRAGIDERGLVYLGRGFIRAALFDLGIYPAAVPDPDGRVWGEVYQMRAPGEVLPALDHIEATVPRNPTRACTHAWKSRLSWRTGPWTAAGRTSTMPRSGAPNASPQATTSNT